MDVVSFKANKVSREEAALRIKDSCRNELWKKGETSGHFQKVISASIDCDRDTLLYKIDQTGAACHTGNRSCFYTSLDEWDPSSDKEE